MLFATQKRRWSLFGAMVVAVAMASVVVVPTNSAQAFTGADFSPGNIISDAMMFNGSAMGPDEVQGVLNSKVPRCTLGDAGKPAGGIYTFPSGFQTTLAHQCLKDYTENVSSIGGDSICGPVSGGVLSAAQIIYRVGLACNVSQKALIVLLEKEQSLITDSFPAQSQYNKATGFNCPDTAPCSAASAGFFRQVYSAARQLQVYGTGSFTWYPVGAVTNILWNVASTGCGSSPVLIQNRATAALYYYTPYQPNGAALGNLYGGGDACSAYGNRNFWVLFNGWFGSTLVSPATLSYVDAAYHNVLNRTPATSELYYWAGQMAQGLSRVGMANAFNNSDEYRNIRIAQAYQAALGRPPEPDGAAYWLDQQRRGAISPENLYSTFLAMDEYYSRGGGTNPGYVTLLYTELLGRAPDAQGLAYWVGRLDSGESRRAISDWIWFSPEKYNVRVTEAYQLLLGRTAGVSEQAYWSDVARRLGPTTMRSMIMATDEYWNRASGLYPH